MQYILNRFLFLLLIIFQVASANCQNIIKGTVTDSGSGEPLAFANIIFNNDQFMGARTDIDGRFSFSAETEIKSLVCTYIGYEKKSLFFEKSLNADAGILIELDPLTNELREVIVRPGENPANLIIRKVIQNKEINDPEKISSFSYTSYNKTIYDFLFSDEKKRDSLLIAKKLSGGHLLVMESTTERRFVRPDLDEETVTGTKVSGFKKPSFVSLATDLQPFSFYGDNIKLFDINYLNPVSRRSPDNYSFTIADTLFQDNDTTFIISFTPIKGRNFDGLTGVLYINTNKYAIQNVIATPSVKGFIDLKIQQQYTFLNGRYWFPEQLNYVLSLRDYPGRGVGIIANGRSYIDNIALEIPIARNSFSTQTVRIDKLATVRDSVFWNSNRREVLTDRERTTYRVIDSIGEKRKFGTILLIMEKAYQNRLPVKFLDIDLSRTFIYNRYEGFRPGLGLYTNEKISDWVTLGGFIGYGLNDKSWKYGGEMLFNISEKHDISFGLKYQYDLVAAGRYGTLPLEQNFLSLRNYSLNLFDGIIEKSVNAGFRALRYTTWNISLASKLISPQYTNGFVQSSGNSQSYLTSELAVNMRFAWKEKIVSSLNQKIAMGTKFPVVALTWKRGINGLWHSDLEYNKLEAAVFQAIPIRKAGTTRYRLEGGFADRSLPAGQLFTGEGSYDKKLPYNIVNTFQTMAPYEFLSDTYANLFLSHNFGSLLFRTGKFAPSVTIHNNAGWGDIRNSYTGTLTGFKTKENFYLESGLQLDNILKINYLNIGYIGFGTAVYYRYGYYSYSDFKDNLALKFTMTYTIK